MEWQAFVGILAIIGIVIVVGGLIAFLGHIIIGAFDNEERSTSQSNQPEVMDYTQYKQQQLLAENTKQQDYNFEQINTAKADKEKELAQDSKDEDLFKLVEDNDADLEEIENRLKSENEAKQDDASANDVKTLEDAPMIVGEGKEKEENQTEDDDFDIESLIDEINNEVVDEEKEKVEEAGEEENPILANYSIDKVLNGTDETEAEQPEQEEQITESTETAEDDVVEDDQNEEASTEETGEVTTEETPVETEEVEQEADETETPTEEVVEETTAPVEDKTEQTSKELEDANKRIAELTSQLESLNKQLTEKQNVVTTEVVIDMTEEECLNRIAVLEERLKNAKKDYKTNMKEYRPLKKVMNDLERYQTKLRRKEAIVAKKKVALYGVNNYVDIDKEKAEKLANELELLDGLRLSVNHCEDVINANKDRFPILEHTNNILEEQISQLESDLELANVTLQKIRKRQGNGEQGSNEGESNE